jgi:hypothetical protein
MAARGAPSTVARVDCVTQAIENEINFAIADLKPPAGAITCILPLEHGTQDTNAGARWSIGDAVPGKATIVTAPVTAWATKIGSSAFLIGGRCVSECDVLDLLGYILVDVFQRCLVHDHRFASGS